MIERIRQHHISFRNAFAGIRWALQTQPNFRVHIFLSLSALLLALVLDISAVEITILVLIIVFGLGVEMVNTAIECVTDLVTQEWRMEAKIAKDVAAGMMLLTAIGAVIVASLIFLPKIYLIMMS